MPRHLTTVLIAAALIGCDANTPDINTSLTSIELQDLVDPGSTPSLRAVEAGHASLPATIQAEDYVIQSGIRIGQTTDTGGSDFVGWIENGDYTEYTINVPQAGTYQLNARVASRYQTAQVNFSIAGTVAGSVTVAPTGGWDDWITVTTTLQLAAGDQTLRLDYSGSNSPGLMNLNWFSLSVDDETPLTTGDELDSTNWTVTANQNTQDAYLAIDGDSDTRWTTQARQTNGQVFSIDLGASETFNQLALNSTESPGDYPRSYKVEVSTDESNWSEIATGTGNNNGETLIEFAEQQAAFLRITQLGSTDKLWWSIHELSLYGDDTNTPPVTPTTPTSSNTTLFEPVSYFKIARGLGGFSGAVVGGDRFGRDSAPAGDINGDGIVDLILGARSDDDGGTDTGAAYILFMNANGTVDSNQKISLLEGNFTGNLAPNSFFGYGVAGIGDYDGDSIPDVAVSAPRNDSSVFILHLNRDGTVKSMVRNTDIVALGLSAVGDLNQDGKIDLVAADPNATGGGAAHLLFMDDESRVDQIVTIGEGQGGFGTGLNEGDTFGGRESALLGDLDNNGTLELAVGAFQSDGGQGAVWILSLDNETHEVVDKLKIAPGLAGFNETLESTVNSNGTTGPHFGHAMAAAGDLNNDGVPDLITSANQYEDGVSYVLYLNADKTVKTFNRLTDTNAVGGFELQLQNAERFGRSISLVDDSRADGIVTGIFGGGAGYIEGVYSVDFQECSYESQTDPMYWADGTTLFSNWNHGTQTVTGPLTFEQCTWKAAETGGTNITAKAEDGRCIVKESDAILSVSDENSTAYVRSCP